MRRIICFIMMVITCLSLAACGGNNVEKVEEKALNAIAGYSSGKEFMIKGWLMPNTNTYESYKLVKELGITHVMIDGGTGVEFGTEQFENVMGYMHELGVNGVFTLGNADREASPYDGMDQDFRRYPAIKGINYFDEPRGSEQNRQISEMISAHEKKYGNELFAYTNLFPYSVYNEGYDDYVKNFCDEVIAKINGRKILAMDVYPYYSGDKLIESTWLAGLETIGKHARDYGAEMQIWIQRLNRHIRIDDKSRLHSCLPDVQECLRRLVCGIEMEAEHRCADPCKAVDVFLRMDDHKMHVQRLFGNRCYRLHNRKSI